MIVDIIVVFLAILYCLIGHYVVIAIEKNSGQTEYDPKDPLLSLLWPILIIVLLIDIIDN